MDPQVPKLWLPKRKQQVKPRHWAIPDFYEELEIKPEYKLWKFNESNSSYFTLTCIGTILDSRK